MHHAVKLHRKWYAKQNTPHLLLPESPYQLALIHATSLTVYHFYTLCDISCCHYTPIPLPLVTSHITISPQDVSHELLPHCHPPWYLPQFPTVLLPPAMSPTIFPVPLTPPPPAPPQVAIFPSNISYNALPCHHPPKISHCCFPQEVSHNFLPHCSPPLHTHTMSHILSPHCFPSQFLKSLTRLSPKTDFIENENIQIHGLHQCWKVLSTLRYSQFNTVPSVKFDKFKSSIRNKNGGSISLNSPWIFYFHGWWLLQFPQSCHALWCPMMQFSSVTTVPPSMRHSVSPCYVVS